MKPDAGTIDLDGIPVQTLNLEGLLLTKQTVRHKDASNRLIIERALEVFKNNSGPNRLEIG